MLQSDQPSVDTRSGTVRGFLRDGVRTFLGIPYAEPPIGPLRFRAPVAIEPWTGIRDATTFGDSAMPPESLFLNGKTVSTTPDGAISEDCLTINVWTPATAGPHPIMVWIYGGANFVTGPSDPIYSGANFARDGICCISIGYRTGAFGFLDVSGLFGAAYRGSGNNALRDVILGLHWIHANAAAFGGDPARVSIIGPSAGAMNIAALFAVPEVLPLFDRAILLSGGQRVHRQDEAYDVANRLRAAAGLAEGQADALLTMPAEALLAAQMKVMAEYPRRVAYRPVVDDVVLTAFPIDAVRAGAVRDKPLLLSHTRDECAFRHGHPLDAEHDARENATIDAATFERMRTRYAAVRPDLDPASLRIAVASAEAFGIPVLRLAEAQSAAGGAVYLTRFDYAPVVGDFAGRAQHGADMPLWIGDPWVVTLSMTAPDPAVERVSDRMHAALVRFVHGQPPGEGWGPYAPPARTVMIFDRQDRIESDPDGDERELWVDIL